MTITSNYSRQKKRRYLKKNPWSKVHLKDRVFSNLKVFTAVWVRNSFFWDMTWRHWVVGSRRFEGTQCLLLQWYRLPRRMDSSRNSHPCRWRHYVPSKGREPIIKRRGVMYQMNAVFKLIGIQLLYKFCAFLNNILLPVHKRHPLVFLLSQINPLHIAQSTSP
jgi:hypothetical protein